MTSASGVAQQKTAGEASVYIASVGSSYLDVGSGESARKPSPRKITWTLRLLAGVKEEDGEFSSYCLNLPGAVSCGDSKEEAFENIREAVEECISLYRDMRKEIPWAEASGSKDEYDFVKWIEVDV